MKNSVDKFVELIVKADDIGRIMAAALVCSGVGQDGTDIVAGYTRADFKRAIEGLKASREQNPQYAAYYEGAIGHIRRVWLHGGAIGQEAAS